MIEIALLLWTVVGVGFIGWFVLSQIALHRYVRRENARRHAEWLKQDAEAKARGDRPVQPPLRLMVG